MYQVRVLRGGKWHNAGKPTSDIFKAHKDAIKISDKEKTATNVVETCHKTIAIYRGGREIK